MLIWLLLEMARNRNLKSLLDLYQLINSLNIQWVTLVGGWVCLFVFVFPWMHASQTGLRRHSLLHKELSTAHPWLELRTDSQLCLSTSLPMYHPPLSGWGSCWGRSVHEDEVHTLVIPCNQRTTMDLTFSEGAKLHWVSLSHSSHPWKKGTSSCDHGERSRTFKTWTCFPCL